MGFVPVEALVISDTYHEICIHTPSLPKSYTYRTKIFLGDDLHASGKTGCSIAIVFGMVGADPFPDSAPLVNSMSLCLPS